MLLRSITKHVKDQNWFAVALDFFIVVVGILIAFQITNWNEERSDKIQEAAIHSQLEDEFTEIQKALALQTRIREGYASDLLALIGGLEGSGPVPDDLAIKRALSAARSTGRRPAQSSGYLQLTSNGDLARLSNEKLKDALIRYHARLERDAFIFPELMQIVVQELSSNAHVDYDPHISTVSAAIDVDAATLRDRELTKIRSYDFDGLREYEQRYEAIYVMHANLAYSDNSQLNIVEEILEQISQETE